MAERRTFEGNDNCGRPRSEFVAKLAKLSDDKLYSETKNKIWLSAYARNNPKSDYHWHVSAIYDEWAARGKESEYERAFNEIKRETCGE